MAEPPSHDQRSHQRSLLMRVDGAASWDRRYLQDPESAVDLRVYTPVVRDLLLASRTTLQGLNIENGAVLDIGGGTGKAIRFFELGAARNHLHLVDFSQEAVAVATANGFQASRCDIETQPLPYEDAYFDLVLAQELIEHLDHYDRLIGEAYRVLKPGGYFYVTTPNLAGLIDRLKLLRGRKPLAMQWDETHIRFFTFPELEGLLEHAGFAVVRSMTQGAYLSFRGRFLRIPLLAHLRRDLGQHIMLLARKEPPPESRGVRRSR